MRKSFITIFMILCLSFPLFAQDAKTEEEKFDFLFRKLNVIDTQDLVRQYVTQVKVYPEVPTGL